MLNLGLKPNSKRSRRQIGPIIVAIFFLLAACGLSFDFFAEQMLSGESDAFDPTAFTAPPPKRSAPASEVNGELNREESGKENSDANGLDGAIPTAIPSTESLPRFAGPKKRRSAGRLPSSEDEIGDVGIVRDRQYPVPEINLDVKEDSYKINLSRKHWKGNPQLLPSPMFVSQLRENKRGDIRGGGWIAIDIAKSQIIPVELFKGKSGAHPVIEAKRLDGHEIVTSSNTGFPISRGIPDLLVGPIDVFENPPCLVRFGGVTETEICEVTLKALRIRYKFEPPFVAPDETRSDNALSTVWIDAGLGNWVQIGSFNENFYPLGDANHDGYPDFFSESVTGSDESGVQSLLMSHLSSDKIEYLSYETRYRSAR